MTESSGARKWQELVAQTKREQVAPGDVIAGRFRVQEHLGTGGMGVVLSAIDLQDNQEVALKILRMADVDETGVQRFVREARTSMRIQSPYVVKVLDTGLDTGRPFIVMERLHGADLSERLRRNGPVALWETADILLMVCEALANAHGAGVVHRDIKLSNLFMATESQDGSLLGSPPYMAPEQIRNAKTVDHRADIWSMGVVAYRLLSGEHPYHGDTVGEVFASILDRRFRTLASRGVKLPQEVEAIISNCMQVDLAKRYQNVGELAVVDISRQCPPPVVNSGVKADPSTATVTHGPGSGGDEGSPTIADPTEVAAFALPTASNDDAAADSVDNSTGGSRGTGINVVRNVDEAAEFEPWFRRVAAGKVAAVMLGALVGLGSVATALGAFSGAEAEGSARTVRERSQGVLAASHPARGKLLTTAAEEPTSRRGSVRAVPVSTAAGQASAGGKPQLQPSPYE
jgi:eukaryotic-like serine/threonine-protein kinase